MKLLKLIRVISDHPLNAQGRTAALSRFIRWQFASRLIGQPIALPYVNETRLLVTTGMTGATGNWYNGLHEPEEMAFVLHALRPADLFVDIGANVGSFTILAAGAVGAKAIAIEPLPSTHARLLENIRLNDVVDLVEPLCCGISSIAGELRFTDGLDTMNRVARADETVLSQMVPVTTLDHVCAMRMPTIIKIDVEGHECAVLAGGAKVLSSPNLQAVLMETNGSGARYGHTDAEIIETMCSFGFTPCRYVWQSCTLTPTARGAANTIFVRDPAGMSARCSAASRFSLVNGTI